MSIVTSKKYLRWLKSETGIGDEMAAGLMGKLSEVASSAVVEHERHRK